ncbi:hypothetical protein KY284_030069 [Solanum tuberosum]|nr:hypothetical protein KY284_030069 [Solanum tuberosum]
MRKEVKEFIQKCDVCQRNKSNLAAYPGLLQPLPISDIVWSQMDFIDGLPKSQGYEVILVVVDKLSKYGHFLPLKHPYTAQLVAKTSHVALSYLLGESAFAEVDGTLVNKELRLQLKHHLRRAQLRMKQQADSHRSDRHFDVGDWVYFKVQPYKQATISNHLSHKRCYEVPSQISHPPTIDLANPHCPDPEMVLQRTIVKRGNKVVAQLLVKWFGLPAELPGSLQLF